MTDQPKSVFGVEAGSLVRAPADVARIAELEAALREIADMQSESEPVAYSWGLEYFNRAHAIAKQALEPAQ